jgi:hypothetical protein
MLAFEHHDRDKRVLGLWNYVRQPRECSGYSELSVEPSLAD